MIGIVPIGQFIACSGHEAWPFMLRADVQSAAYCGQVGAGYSFCDDCHFSLMEREW